MCLPLVGSDAGSSHVSIGHLVSVEKGEGSSHWDKGFLESVGDPRASTDMSYHYIVHLRRQPNMRLHASCTQIEKEKRKTTVTDILRCHFRQRDDLCVFELKSDALSRIAVRED